MKTLYTSIFAFIFCLTIYGQAPQKMSYQAVVRDASNALVSNQPVGVQISILEGSSTGTSVYVETQTPTTNANGLVSLIIGDGSVVSGDLSNIDWSSNSHYVQIDTDPTGGSSYTVTGTSQLLSVPYAMYADKSGEGGVPNGTAAGNTPYWDGTNWVTSSNIFNNGGRVGINQSSPERQLHVHSNTTYSFGPTPSLMLSDNFQKWNLGLGYDPAFRFSIASEDLTERFVIQQTGNIGIGTNDPTDRLHVVGSVKIENGTQGAGKVLTSDANGVGTWQDAPSPAAPYYHFPSVGYTQTMTFPVGEWGAIITMAMRENCVGSKTVGGMIHYDPTTNEVFVMNSSGGSTANGSGTNSITSSGNVLTLNNGCVPMTFTFTYSAGDVTITVGGDPGGVMNCKWMVLGM